MKAPPRLVDGGDLRAQLLRSARGDAPGVRSRRRATAAVALAAGALATRSTAALAAATVTRSALVKVILGAGVMTLLAAGTPDAPPAQTPAEHAAVVATARHAVAVHASPPPAPPRAVEIAPPDPPPVPEVAPAPAPSPSPLVKMAPAPRPPSTLADEVAQLGEAKRALEAGRHADALAALAAHDRRFPHGVLSQEAAALRVEAAARSGDRATAASLARAFEATYPASPLRDRMRDLGAASP